jgi:hypothetical protein
MASQAGLNLPGVGGGADSEKQGGEGSGNLLGGIGSKLSGLLGGLGSKVASAGAGIFSFLGGLIPHAEGGPVSPSSAYLVGERGPEILTGASGYIASAAASRRILDAGGAQVHHWHVDARNADIGVAGRLNQAMDRLHSSAVKTAVAITKERSMRTVQTGRA